MKLRLPRQLMAAVVAAVSAVTFGTLATGTAAYGSTTYDDLTTKDYFETNEHVYNTGTGKFYLETTSCDLNLTLTLNLNKLNDFQTVHDYANGGYYSPFVTWTYNNNPGATYGMADVARGYSGVNYDSGFTGYWAGSPWTTGTKITTDTLWTDYADTDGNVTLTINNTPNGTTNNVVVTATNKSGTVQTLYSANGLRSQDYTSQHITSFTVNMNYVTSVTLNTTSTLDSSDFTPPKDYTIPFESERTDGTSVGRVLFMGDSITHGVQDMSYRWGLFKTFVDNGIENEIAGPLSGYHSDPLNSDYNGNYSSSQYGGETFDNAHYAQSSGRTHNMLTASGSVNALGNSTGVNYGGVSSAKVGKEYNADTYIMMMGTNDILSDGASNDTNMSKVTERLLGAGSVQNGAWVNADQLSALVGAAGTAPETAAHKGKWGTMGQIIDNVKMNEGDTMYVLSIPTWAQGRENIRVYANYVPSYNENLKLWTEAYSDSHTGTVKYVDINRGLVDKTLGGTFLGPNDFFRQVGGDYLHPNEQGALIIAGNLAQGMGLAGRTAGLHRADSQTAGTTWLSGEAEYTINAGQSVNLATNAFNVMGGYTVDFSANFGNGATDGWLDKTNALSISVGDGSNVGTLKLSEGYISWGDNKLLFCQDNSVQGNDNIRIAYHTGDADHQVGQGYYVWLGDMLIGQALTAGSGSLNGITLSSVGATGTVSGLTYINTAYAPTTTGITSAENAFYATITKVLESHDNADKVTGSGIDWTNAVTNTAQKGVTAASSFTNGKATVELTNVGGWFAAGAVTATGDIEAKLSGKTTTNNGFAVQGGTLTGNVTMEITDSTVNEGGYATAGITQKAALAGSFGGATVTGTFAAYVDGSTLNGDMVGGTLNGTGSIGAVDFVVNSGVVNGTVYGGSKTDGTVGNGTADSEGNFSNTAVAITVNGGHVTGDVNGGGTAGTVKGNAEITINGGIIDGNITGGDIQGSSTVTVEGNKALIGGNITADTVKLKQVEASEYSDTFDKYKGRITATNLVLDNYTAGKVNATLVTDYVTATNGTIATIHGLTLRNCSIDATGATALTLGENIHSGNTISYSGNIRLEDGTSFTIDNPTAVAEGSEGFSDGVYIYKVSDDQTGSLQAADGTALTGTHTATFTGTDALAGKLFSYESSTGALIAHSNTATYNIVSSTVDYSGISSAAGVTMSGGQLNLDTALTGGTITATGGTVNIGEGVTLASSSVSGTVTLAGEGTFSIGNAKDLPTGVSLHGTDWTGTVVLSGEVTGGHAFQNLSTANSSVTLQGVRSWIQKNGNVTANLVLNGDDNGSASGAALSITGANNTGNGGTYTFSGPLSGSGDIAYIQTDERNSIFVISGDTSDWSGSFVNYNNGTPQVKLTPSTAGSVIGGGVEQRGTGTLAVTIGANAATVNGAIQQINGMLNLTLEGAATTFNNDVTVNNLSASGKTITIGSNEATHGALTVSGTANIGTLKMAGDDATVTFNGTTTLGAIQANGGHGNMVIDGETALSTGALTLAADQKGTQLTIDKHLTVTGGNYVNVAYSNNDQTGTSVTFNDGLSYTGSHAYALAVGKNSSVTFAGGSSDLTGKTIGMAAGSVLTVENDATLTVGRIFNSDTSNNNGTLKLKDNAQFTLVSGNNTNKITTLSIEGNSATATFNANTLLESANQTVGGTVRVNNATLTSGSDARGDNTTQTYNRLELNGATFKSGTNGDNNVRNLTTLAVGGNSTLSQVSWHTLWNIGSLNNLDAQNPGTLTWDSTTNHNKTSIMTLTSAGDFSGKLVVNRHTDNASNGSYQAYLQVNHAQALQNATVELKGTNTNNNAAMALNTSAVTIAGLEGTANSIVYAGAANTAPGSEAPTSTGTSTLTINAAADHSFAGTVASGVSLTKEGSGTQTFNGNLNGFNGLVKANGGKLVLANSAETANAVALSGIFINNGTLELSGGKYTVGSASANTNGLFAETKAADTGSLVLSNGANLAVDASSKDWRFQVNSGEGAGIYVKGADSSLDVSLNDGGQVSFKALDATSETGARIAKNDGNGESFGVGKDAISVSDADYTLAYNKDVTVKNTLTNTAVTNNGTGKLTVDNANNTLVGVHAAMGDIDLLNTANVSLAELSVGGEHTVSVVNGAALAADESNVGNVTVTGLLTASEGSTLNANLTLAEGAAYTSHGALTMGCTVTIGGDLILSVDGDANVAPVAIFTDVESLTLGDTTYTYEQMGWYDAAGIITSLNGETLSGDYVIGYWNGTVSFAEKSVPEPATATLSLLALAALAARRKRK